MEIRSLTPGDAEAIRRIAQASLESSYSDIFDEDTILHAVKEWYSPEAFDDYLDSDEMVFWIAVEDEQPVAFSQSHVLEDIEKGRILWLHVYPDYRGRGIATALLEETRDLLHDRGIERVTSLVIADNEEGNEFYQEHGFSKLYGRTIQIAGKEHTENVYGEPGAEPGELEPWSTPGGPEVYIDFDETNHGSKGVFFALYNDPTRDDRFGWFCSNCESPDTVMDPMGRIECPRCGNRRKATRWDAAYL